MQQKNTINLIWLLIVGIILGFIIGQIGLVIEWPWQKPQSPAVSQAVPVITQQNAVNTTQQNTQEATPVPKYFDEVKNVSADNDPFLGSADAKLTVVEFSEYQCSFCKKYFDNVFGNIKKNYIDSGKIKYVVRDFPLDTHPQSLLASQTANCAGAQGKFWEMHEALFLNQNSWSYQDNAEDVFKSYATALKLNQTEFEQCLKSPATLLEIEKDIKDAELYGATRIPVVFIGDKKIVGAQPYSTYELLINEALKK